MNVFKSRIATALIAAGALTMMSMVNVAQAQSSAPRNYQAKAQQYFESRIEEPSHVRISFQGPAYKAEGRMRTRSGQMVTWSGWAVDMRVNMDTSAGGRTGRMAHTVIFVDGRPIALKRDVESFRRIGGT